METAESLGKIHRMSLCPFFSFPPSGASSVVTMLE